MKLYLLTQSASTGYNTFDSILVAAKNEEDAKTIAPNGQRFPEEYSHVGDWARTTKQVDAELIGIARKGIERGVVIASFNAG